MAQQKFTVKVSSKYDRETRVAIGLEIIERLLKRTEKGLDKNNKSFPGYSESYKNSLDFKLAGKSKNKVNLRASDEMLSSVTLLDESTGQITIGIPEDDEFNNAKAEGNIKGSYGGKANKRKARDFMGISRSDLSDIKSDFPINNKKNRESTASKALKALLADEIARDIAGNFLDIGSLENDL